MATGGIIHEISTFTTVSTTIDAREHRLYHQGREILDQHAICGFIAGAHEV